MEELCTLYKKSEEYKEKLRIHSENFLQELHIALWGNATTLINDNYVGLNESAEPCKSPRQIPKRIKRLSSLQEQESEGLTPKVSNIDLKPVIAEHEEEKEIIHQSQTIEMNQQESLTQNQSLLQPLISKEETSQTNASVLMPPPSAPGMGLETAIERTSVRPQRAAKLKPEKSYKELKINQKMRRPSTDSVRVKLEHEQRHSQMNEANSNTSKQSNESVVVIPEKPASIVELSEDEISSVKEKEITVQIQKGTENLTETVCREVIVKVKREKSSNSSISDSVTTATVSTLKVQQTGDEPSTLSVTTTNTVVAAAKKTRKKKEVHKPIKVERFSDILPASSPPVSTRTRTRSGSNGQKQMEHQENEKETEKVKEDQQIERAASMYEDAVDNLSNNLQKKPLQSAADVTVTLANKTITATMLDDFAALPTDQGQNTFVVPTGNPNATVTLGNKTFATACEGNDATFNVVTASKEEAHIDSLVSSKQSMETARDTSMTQDDTLITEDDSREIPKEEIELPMPKAPILKAFGTNKNYKLPNSTKELFNPLIQSPVKMKVKAFENAAHLSSNTGQNKLLRSKFTKENSTPTISQLTPSIGKVKAAALGRFLTPTQGSNITPNAVAQVKKGPNSASKAMASAKSIIGMTSSVSSSKALSRENSAEDFRKGLHQVAEERKKQREQKLLLAAQQREAKEKERSERLAKLAEEREKKRLKKQMETEKKKRELEEIQRKLKQAELAEAAKLKTIKSKPNVEQERIAAKSKMMPPPPKLQSKYTFEMLHEDDSTDDEDKTSYKRPPPPAWSRRYARGETILRQQYWPTDIIDSFFSVQPMTPDLKKIFPNINAQCLKRNSSVMWTTPPRYSQIYKP